MFSLITWVDLHLIFSTWMSMFIYPPILHESSVIVSCHYPSVIYLIEA